MQNHEECTSSQFWLIECIGHWLQEGLCPFTRCAEELHTLCCCSAPYCEGLRILNVFFFSVWILPDNPLWLTGLEAPTNKPPPLPNIFFLWIWAPEDADMWANSLPMKSTNWLACDVLDDTFVVRSGQVIHAHMVLGRDAGSEWQNAAADGRHQRHQPAEVWCLIWCGQLAQRNLWWVFGMRVASVVWLLSKTSVSGCFLWLLSKTSVSGCFLRLLSKELLEAAVFYWIAQQIFPCWWPWLHLAKEGVQKTGFFNAEHYTADGLCRNGGGGGGGGVLLVFQCHRFIAFLYAKAMILWLVHCLAGNQCSSFETGITCSLFAVCKRQFLRPCIWPAGGVVIVD